LTTEDTLLCRKTVGGRPQDAPAQGPFSFGFATQGKGGFLFIDKRYVTNKTCITLNLKESGKKNLF